MIQENAWSCGVVSLAMLLKKSVPEIIKLIGHDGSEVCWPDETHEGKRVRGFGVQELKDAAFSQGIALLEIHACPAHTQPSGQGELLIYKDFEKRLDYYMSQGPGLIFGYYSPDMPHMVYWDGKMVHDPKDGSTYGFNDDMIHRITIESFYLALEIKSQNGENNLVLT